MAGTFTGCGTQGGVPAAQSGTELQGRVRGGQQPVSGASIVLYAAGSSGNGAGAINLLAPYVVTTDASGNFGITGDYTCPTATTQVYLVARGGNPGLANGTTNPALSMMAALGDCGNLSSSTYITINEVTTAAAAWALAQFIAPGAIIGSSATNATGLRNAFAGVANLVNSSTGLAPGASLPTGAMTETAKLYTLANVLAACVNSDGTTGCAPLFSAATVNSSAPANTLDAALAIVHNPSSNVAAVFAASPSQAPFQPQLSASPNDWTMSVTYGGCTPACGGLNIPGAVAVDSTGSVWVANYSGGVVSKFAPNGVPVAASGFAGAGLRASYGITVDGQDSAWVTNQNSTTAAGNSHQGSVSEFSSTGTELSGGGYTGGGIYYPQAVAADSTGAIWVADYGDSTASLLANDGSAISGSSGYGRSLLPFTTAVAVDASHNAWFAVQQGAARVTPAGVVSSVSCCNDPVGIAVDPTGNIWISDYGANSIYELSAAGSVLGQAVLGGGNDGPQGIAIDGAGRVWAANYRGDSISEVASSNSGGLSQAVDYGLDALLDDPYGIAVDASGNLWISNAGDYTLTQVVGVASPIKTPLLGPPAQP